LYEAESNSNDLSKLVEAISFWRIFLVLGSLAYLGASGIFTLKLIAAATGRKRILDFFTR